MVINQSVFEKAKTLVNIKSYQIFRILKGFKGFKYCVPPSSQFARTVNVVGLHV